MALPRVNSTSWFDIEIPSNKEKIQIRPFLVKEQKILLLAGETQDKVQIINAMLDTIASCTRDEIDTKNLLHLMLIIFLHKFVVNLLAKQVH